MRINDLFTIDKVKKLTYYI